LESEAIGLYSATVGYDDRGFPTTNASRVRELVRSIQKLDEAQPADGVDVVHCLGADCGSLAVDLGAALGAATLVEAWRTSSFGSVSEALRRRGAGAAVVFPDPGLRRAWEQQPRMALRGGGAGFDAFWGVHPGERLAGGPGPEGEEFAPGVAVLADGSRPDALAAVMCGLAEVASKMPELLIFADTEKARSAQVWKLARQYRLLDRLSIVPGIEARREPILRLGALLVPEPTGKMRSLILDAMARSVPVVATPDPALGVLSDPAIARLVPTSTPGAWAEGVRAALAAGAGESPIVAAAREFIRTQRTASAHVAAVLKTYEAAVSTRSRTLAAA
jgi:hypothetical protein